MMYRWVVGRAHPSVGVESRAWGDRRVLQPGARRRIVVGKFYFIQLSPRAPAAGKVFVLIHDWLSLPLFFTTKKRVKARHTQSQGDP